MSNRRKIYWDSSCFICFLNKAEAARRKICEDILYHAQDRKIELWTSTWTIVEVVRPNRHSLPASGKLSPEQIIRIQAMFEWDWLKKVQVDQIIAARAVELQRDFGLRAGDSIHAATAIRIKADTLQRWDRDFDKVGHLINVEDPQKLTVQAELIEGFKKQIGPAPEDFSS
jgi:predicted nucleic acid-binding protein